jgi:hypothetical protein
MLQIEISREEKQSEKLSCESGEWRSHVCGGLQSATSNSRQRQPRGLQSLFVLNYHAAFKDCSLEYGILRGMILRVVRIVFLLRFFVDI